MIPLAPPALSPLSKYELIEEIGHGGMATVYRARDTRLGREVALKLLHRHLRESSEIEARFASEARAVAKLRHPNIVAVYDVSEENEVERYLVMELVRGQTLRQLLKQRGALPVELAAGIVLEIAAALEHAHAEGVVHRDVKPENVLIDMGGAEASSGEDAQQPRVKLTDFGIAKLLDAQGVTSTGQVLGSPAHMAPEQIEGRPVDGRADVFSLGVLFYECVAGCLPFDGRNPAQVLRNVLEGNFQPPDRVKPEIGSLWSRLIVKALERDPDARHLTIAQFAAAMRAEVERTGFGAVRHEISSFLIDPIAFAATFTERAVAGCVKSGLEARRNREHAVAGAQFARALAYKPGDPELLRHVSGLRNRRRALKAGIWGAALAAVIGVGMAAAQLGAVERVSGWWRGRQPVEDRGKGNTGPITSATSKTSTPVPSSGEQSVAVVNVPDKGRRRGSRDDRGARPPPKHPETPEVPETRRVAIKIVGGAAGGSVRIDGREVPWFGVTHELPVGSHVFDFIPPNDTCCVADKRQIEVLPGDEVQSVTGRISFKPASLELTSSVQGVTVSCPTLFAGSVHLPGSRSVPMSQVQARGLCMFAAEGSAPQTKNVTLNAGQSAVLSYP